MKKTPNPTNTELSALEQRDITPYCTAIQALSWLVLSNKRNHSPPSPTEVKYRQSKDRLPHSFYSVGDGVHVLPITIDNLIVSGCTVTPDNVSRCRGLWLPEWGIDRRYLIFGSFLFLDIDALTGRDQGPRKLFSLRTFRAFHRLGFPAPSGNLWLADVQLRAELPMKDGTT